MYEAIKGLHMLAMAVWVIGAVVIPLRMGRADAAGLARLRGLSQRVVTPAMLVTWALGLWMGISTGMIAAPWLSAKMVVVLALTGVYGVTSGRLRKAVAGQAVPTWIGVMPVAVVGLAAIAVWLAYSKPF